MMLVPHTFYIWQDMAVHLGPGFASDPHRHFASQICLGLDSPFSLRAGKHEAWRTYAAAVIPSGCWHQTDMQPVRLAMVYLNPLSSHARGVCRLIGCVDGISSIPQDYAARVIETLRRPVDEPETLRAAVDGLMGDGDPAFSNSVDARVALAVTILEKQADQLPALPEIARQVTLSPSRFRHLFREELGISFSAYRLWNRVIYATRLLTMNPGVDLTWVAHESGFADSAHFSRVFHRVFGLKPSDIFKSGEFRLVLCG